MLKHGSGMAVCLKYFSNKVSSFVPLVFRRPHVFISNRQVSNDSSLSPLRHECGVSVASSSPDHQMCLDSHVRCEKTLKVQCCTNVIDHVSVFASEDKLLNQPNQLAKSCTFSFSDASFMCYGAEDHFKTACDLEVSHSLSGERKYGGTHLICSSLELLKSGPGDRKEDLSSQGRKEISETFKPPSEEQLEIVARNLATTLPSFFVKPVIMRTIYHHNIVLEDNIRGKRFSGIEQYSFQCQLLYVIGHLRFTYINLDVMKVTSHPEDGTVKVRWRISVFPLSRIWRLKLFNLSASFQDAKDIWIDGFSTYFVLGDGMIHKHIVDKMIPDPDQVTKKPELTKTVPVPNPMAYSDRNKV